MAIQSINLKDQPPKDQPPKDQPPKDQPPKDQPPKDQPPKDQPPKDQPPKDQPPKDQPTLNSINTDKKNQILDDINRIDNWANVGSDNGLFDQQDTADEKTFDYIQDKLKNARTTFNKTI